MPSRGIYVDPLKELVNSNKSDDVLFAFLRACSDVEGLLFEKLFWEKEIEMELIESFTLGKLIQWNYRLGLINEESNKFLQEFCFLRNQMFHERLMFERAKENKVLLECIRNATIKSIEFMENTWAVYKWNDKLEKKYSNYNVNKTDNIISKLKTMFPAIGDEEAKTRDICSFCNKHRQLTKQHILGQRYKPSEDVNNIRHDMCYECQSIADRATDYWRGQIGAGNNNFPPTIQVGNVTASLVTGSALLDNNGKTLIDVGSPMYATAFQHKITGENGILELAMSGGRFVSIVGSPANGYVIFVAAVGNNE